MSKFTRKRVAVVGAIAALSFAAVAVAYFTTSGSGSGSGTVDTTIGTLDLTSSVPALTELGDSQTITVYAANTNASPLHITSLTVVPTDPAGCPEGSFTVGDVTLLDAANQVAPGGPVAVATADVTFNNLDAAQNACLAGPSFDLDSL